MTWTRAYQLGYEMQSNDEHDLITSTTHPTNQSVTVHSGARAAQFTTSTYAAGKNLPAGIVQVRTGVFFRHVGVVTAGSQASILSAKNSQGEIFRASWYEDDNTIRLVKHSTVVDTITAVSAGITNFNRWYHAGMTLKIGAPDGFFSFYLEHRKILTFTGDTTAVVGSGDSIAGCYGGGRHANTVNGWTNGAIFDDFYIDTSDGSEADALPPPKRYFFGMANGNGTNSDWLGSDADSTDNYLLVDDGVPDDDTTYVGALLDALKDTYQCANVTFPVTWLPVAAIPTVRAKEQTTEANLKMLTFDGTLYNTGAAETLTAAYLYYWERFATQPDASAWSASAINAAEIGYESEV